MKYTIWTNNLDYEDWQEELEVYYPEAEGYTENDRINYMYEWNNSYLDDEKANLNKELHNPIIMFGTLGLWHGVVSGYKFLKGTNLNSIFDETAGDYVTWYVEDGEVKCDDSHHDGTNHYTYHVLKKEYSKDDFEDYAYEHSVKEALALMTEPIGQYVEEIYEGSKTNETI